MSSSSEVGHQQAVAVLMDSRQTVREFIGRASERMDPTVGRRPETDIKSPGADPIAVLHVRMHNALMDYHDQLAHRADELEELWTEELEGGISLADLPEYRYRSTSERVERRDGARGQVTETEEYRMLLPLTVVVDAYQQLNKCVDELGLFPRKKRTPLHAVKWDPEDYDEPTVDSIERPS